MAGIYIHIPFCRKACHYCDFHFSTSLKLKEDFVKALCKEIDLRKNYIDQKVETIYFGGGTPSILSGDEIKIILEKINKNFSVDADIEITLEANPDDLSKMHLAEINTAGINRLSIGIQSFDDGILKWMNRTHTADAAIQCVNDAADAGIKNISVDLIYGLPGLSDELWRRTIEMAGALPVQHLSCYALTVEEKTALNYFIKKGKVRLPEDEISANQFLTLVELAEKNNFEQYEISNFAREKKYSKHNSSYWKGINYLGLGPSAHSYNGISRQWNVSNNNLYLKNVNEKLDFFEKEILTTSQKFNEYLMTGLRTKWGADLKKIENNFGENYLRHFLKTVEKFILPGIIINENGIVTIAKQHWFKADSIISELFFI